MSVTAPPIWSATPFPPFALRRFAVDEYHRMVRAGVLNENDRVGLLEGWIVAKMPHHPSHDATIHLVDMQVEAYSDPSGAAANPGYRQHQTYRTGEALPLVIGSQNVGSIAVRDLLV